MGTSSEPRFGPLSDEPEPEFRFTPSGMCNALACILGQMARRPAPTSSIVMSAAHVLATHSLDGEKADTILGVAEIEQAPASDLPLPLMVQTPEGPGLN